MGVDDKKPIAPVHAGLLRQLVIRFLQKLRLPKLCRAAQWHLIAYLHGPITRKELRVELAHERRCVSRLGIALQKEKDRE